MRTILLTDAIIDLCVLLTAQIAVGNVHPIRILAAWAVLACGNPLLSFARIASAFRILIPICACVGASSVLNARKGVFALLETAFCVFLASLAAAGFVLLGGRTLPWAVIGCAFAACMLRVRRHIRARWNIEVVLEVSGRTVAFNAMIDTGNRLRDRSRRLPVLIVEKEALADIPRRLPESALRPVPYSVLGSGGSIACFVPDAVRFRYVGEDYREAPPCSVGIFPDTIPGIARALAPPEFADAPRLIPKYTQRRVHHAVFEHKAIHLRAGRTDSQRLGMLHRRERSSAAAADAGRGDRAGT